MFKILTPHRLSVGVVAAVAAISAPAWADPSVTITNPGDIAKAEGIQNPYQAATDCAFSGLGVCTAVLQTPASQRLVFEFVSAFCDLPAGSNVTVAQVETSVGGNAVGHFLSIPPPISEQVRLYADPSTTITFTIGTPSHINSGTCFYTVSGQTVAVP